MVGNGVVVPFSIAVDALCDEHDVPIYWAEW